MCRDVLENANELRIMLCREKRSGTRTGTSVIAACGEQPECMNTVVEPMCTQCSVTYVSSRTIMSRRYGAHQPMPARKHLCWGSMGDIETQTAPHPSYHGHSMHASL